jgi:hypothetical protein
LPFFSNILIPNTVFALLHININHLIFTDAGLLGTHPVLRCRYTGLLDPSLPAPAVIIMLHGEH